MHAISPGLGDGQAARVATILAVPRWSARYVAPWTPRGSVADPSATGTRAVPSTPTLQARPARPCSRTATCCPVVTHTVRPASASPKVTEGPAVAPAEPPTHPPAPLEGPPPEGPPPEAATLGGDVADAPAAAEPDVAEPGEPEPDAELDDTAPQALRPARRAMAATPTTARRPLPPRFAPVTTRMTLRRRADAYGSRRARSDDTAMAAGARRPGRGHHALVERDVAPHDLVRPMLAVPGELPAAATTPRGRSR